MATQFQLNEQAHALVKDCVSRAAELRINVTQPDSDTTILDFGVETQGGLAAGLQLARICMSGLAGIELNATGGDINVPQVLVYTDHPLQSCLLSQYAGWKIATDDFFAMASGPMRAVAQKEELFREFPADENGRTAIGVLEAGSLPSESALQLIKNSLPTAATTTIAVAPTASQAGNLQVVARSVETAMHKLHELGFPVECVLSGSGTAPLPPVAKNDLEGIGRTNDSILYGSKVNLWVDCQDTQIEEVGPKTPSSSSKSHGELFLKLFKDANHDFYALDKALFSPAIVVFHNLKTGRSFEFGETVPSLLYDSFGL